MKKLWVLSAVMLLLSSVVQSESIYLIRHAEKADDGSKDPMLTIQGQQRAQNIADMLSHANIQHVYATDYQRTQLTAKPLADYLGINVTTYNPSELTAFAEQLKQQKGNALVVGHSNTTPMLTHLLSGKPEIKLAETDFDYMFQVVIDGPHKTLTVLKSLPIQSVE
jgi:broad specificity phosphatase PhoE